MLLGRNVRPLRASPLSSRLCRESFNFFSRKYGKYVWFLRRGIFLSFIFFSGCGYLVYLPYSNEGYSYSVAGGPMEWWRIENDDLGFKIDVVISRKIEENLITVNYIFLAKKQSFWFDISEMTLFYVDGRDVESKSDFFLYGNEEPGRRSVLKKGLNGYYTVKSEESRSSSWFQSDFFVAEEEGLKIVLNIPVIYYGKGSFKCPPIYFTLTETKTYPYQ